MASKELEGAILRTVAWFGLLDIPVTTFEVWKWLLQPDRGYTLCEVDAALEESLWLQERLERQDGFVVLKTAEPNFTIWQNSVRPIGELVGERQRRFLDAERKFMKLRRAVRWFSAIPSVRAVAACNTLAWHQTTSQSDIDLFVLCDPGAVWTTRLCLVTPFALLRRRPGEAAVDPFCFSFFLTTDDLNVQSLALPPEDPYLAFWSASLVPIFDRDGIFDRYQHANLWAHAYIPNSFPHPGHEELRPPRSMPRLFPNLRFLEPVFRHLQERRFPEAVRDLANQDTRVVISDRMLKFHENDRRAEYRTRWRTKVAESLSR